MNSRFSFLALAASLAIVPCFVGGCAPESPRETAETEVAPVDLPVVVETADDWTAPEDPANPPKPGDVRVVAINGVEVAFRYVPAGKFVMGASSEEYKAVQDELYVLDGSPKERLAYLVDDEKQREVELTKPFWAMETEATQELWKKVVGTNPCQVDEPKKPVERVSWVDCQRFVDKLDATLGDALGDWRFALPTEAQWEYACRAGTTTRFWFGDALNGDKANCDGTKPCGTEEKGAFLEKTTEVASYEPNPWGLYDTCGNVGEWVRDYYASYPKEDSVDPTGPDKPVDSFARVFRGGAYSFAAGRCRSAQRGWSNPSVPYSFVGFRMVLVDKNDLPQEKLDDALNAEAEARERVK